MSKKPRSRCAHSISADKTICECGNIHIELLDRNGHAFAYATVDPEQALEIATTLMTAATDHTHIVPAGTRLH